MKAVVMHETGGPDVLHYEEAERPEPGDGQVLIRVHAASVNPMDWKYRRGLADKQLPAVLGIDVSGTIEESRGEGFAEGDEVFGLAASGRLRGARNRFRRGDRRQARRRQSRAGRGDTRGGTHRVAGAVRSRRARARARRGAGIAGCSRRRRTLRGAVRKARGGGAGRLARGRRATATSCSASAPSEYANYTQSRMLPRR